MFTFLDIAFVIKNKKGVWFVVTIEIELKKLINYLLFTVVEDKAPINVSTAKKLKDITTPKF